MTTLQGQFNLLPQSLQTRSASDGLVVRLVKQLQQAHAPSTCDKYALAWKKFKSWLAIHAPEITALECNGTIVSIYLSDLIQEAQDKHIGSQLIDTACASIYYYYKMANLSPPVDSTALVLLRRTADRILTAKKSKCEDITALELHSVLNFHMLSGKHCLFKTRYHLTVFLLTFVGLLRFDDLANILVHRNFIQFIHKTDTDSTLDGVVMFLPTSKTDQEWDGKWIAIGATGAQFCPVRLLLDLLSAGLFCMTPTAGFDSGPLLRAVKCVKTIDGHQLAQIVSPLSRPIPALSYTTFRASILLLCIQAGLTKHIGLHAGRVGGSNTAAAADVASSLVCQLGRWKVGTTFSDKYLRMVHDRARQFFRLTRQIWPY
jgi:hypothetical protein